MRRLPVYLLLDTSGSMRGEPLESLMVGLETMLSALQSDPFALESVHLCLLTFDREARVLAPLTPLGDFQLPVITTPESGPTHTGHALELLCACLEKDLRKTTPHRKGDWKPLVFIMTDGKPSDTALYAEMAREIREAGIATVIPCACGMKAREEPLRMLADKVYVMQTMDQADFKNLFLWVTASISAGGKSGALNGELPPPPPEIMQY